MSRQAGNRENTIKCLVGKTCEYMFGTWITHFFEKGERLRNRKAHKCQRGYAEHLIHWLLYKCSAIIAPSAITPLGHMPRICIIIFIWYMTIAEQIIYVIIIRVICHERCMMGRFLARVY